MFKTLKSITVEVLPLVSTSLLKCTKKFAAYNSSSQLCQYLKLHTSHINQGINEFFDDPKNWGKTHIKVGRGWKKDELRLKSNVELHKLWYVLLKEKNMLLTMEHACKENYEIFPNPERIDKVEESMENLESVVRERNNAYYMLEVGELGERPPGEAVDIEGTVVRYQKEYALPKHLNEEYLKDPVHYDLMTPEFYRLMREKEIGKRRYRLRLMKNKVERILRYYPGVDLEELQEKYPEVNVKEILSTKRARGNHNHNF